jgi:sporulation protein YlmC with PRC-barrel domain
MRRGALLIAALAFLVEARAEGRLYDYLYEPGALRLDEIIGMEVLTPEGRRLGRITDLIIERATGMIEAVEVGGARYPLSGLISGDQPGQVVAEFPLPGSASAGATALLPISAGDKSSRASRDLGSPDAIVVDLREGRVRKAQ